MVAAVTAVTAHDLLPVGRAGPALAAPLFRDDHLPDACELHRHADDVTIWYTVTDHEGYEALACSSRGSTDIPAAGLVSWEPGHRAYSDSSVCGTMEMVGDSSPSKREESWLASLC